MTNELKRRRILNQLQSECAALGKLTTKLERDLRSRDARKVA